jgi:hypothetical protein
MEKIRNLENPISSSMKKNITVNELGQQPPKTRGEVAAQEQIRIFREAFVTTSGEPSAPRTRGEVAAQEQMKTIQQVMTRNELQPREPRTRGEVAAQEQIRMLNQVLKIARFIRYGKRSTIRS